MNDYATVTEFVQSVTGDDIYEDFDTCTLRISMDFWNSTPELKRMWEFSVARSLSPEAVLGCCYVIVLMLVPWYVDIWNPLMEEADPPNPFAALVGRSGVGKNRAFRAAVRFLGLDTKTFNKLVPNSLPGTYGGTMASFVKVHNVKRTSEMLKKILEGYDKLEKTPDIVVNEAKNIGEIATQMGLPEEPTEPDARDLLHHPKEPCILHSRLWLAFTMEFSMIRGIRQFNTDGANVMQGLADLFYSEELTETFKTDSVRLRVPDKAYRAGLLIALQPRLAQILLNYHDGGVPQRLLLFNADPSGLEEETALREDNIQDFPPAVTPFSELLDFGRRLPGQRISVDIPTELAQSIRKAIKLTNATDRRGIFTHVDASLTRFTLFLALLHGEQTMQMKYWDLSDKYIRQHNKEVRLFLEDVLEIIRKRSNFTRGNDIADQNHGKKIAEDVRKSDGIRRVAIVAAKGLANCTNTAHLLRKYCTLSCAKDRIASNDRTEYADEAITFAIEQGWIVDMSDNNSRSKLWVGAKKPS